MNPLKTLALTLALLAASAASQTLYFYPPDDAKWIAGRAYISQGSAATAAALELDATAGRCGWYKVSIPSSSPLRNYAQFWLGKPGKDRIGPNGRWSVDFEPGDDFNAVGGVFRLGDIFSSLGNNVYFVADELDPANPDAGWYSSLPAAFNDASRCEFNLAAFIYDTDPSVHPDFSCGSWVMGLDEGNGASTKGTCEEGPQAYNGAKGNLKPECTGVVKGLVKQTLNAQTRKIECDNCTKKGCWTSADWFDKAFKSTPRTNVERCYNMPFTQIKSGTGAGSFEFDSDKMLNAGGRAIGGFFPTLLDTRGDGDYSQCTSCDTKRSADRFPPRVKALTKDIFDAYQSAEGDFKDGDTPKLGVFGLTPAADVIYDWNARNEANTTNTNWGPWYLQGSTALKNTYGSDKTGYDSNAKANQHFCFESHADFYYDPAQKFYFSGDDPIWVYINNKLVIDLGGAHMAAPGSVDLSKQGLTEGELYPIDIFFCDQRTVNSNVRITTNMYVVQRSSFESDLQTRDNTFCADIQGGSDCASKMGGGSSGKWCGNELISNGYTVEFYMVRRGNSADTTHLSPSKNAGNCSGSGKNDFVCYAGIKAQNAVYSCGGRGQCKGFPDALGKLQNLAGNFNVYARLRNEAGVVQGKPIMIDQIKSDTKTRMVWGKAVGFSGKETELKDSYGGITKETQSIIAGRRTPIYISNGSWNDDTHTSFSYDDEEVSPTPYTVTIQGDKTGLTIWNSEVGGDPKYSGTIPASGIETLWVEGDYSIGDKEFTLIVSGKEPALKLKVYQPVLKFMEENFTTEITSPRGYNRWVSDGKPPYVGVALNMYVVAWDREKGKLCDHCSFTLSYSSGTNSEEINNVWGDGIVQMGPANMENGKLATYITGAYEVLGNNYAFWEISGDSPGQTYAEWTELQFKLAPIPIPRESEIFDRNGDGIGDSLIVEFNKSLIKGDGDTLKLVLLEVVWAKGDTVRYYPPGHDWKDLKKESYVRNLYDKNLNGFFNANKAYWQQYLEGDNLNILVFTDSVFSKNIATRGYNSGKGEVRSYTPFYDDGLFQYTGIAAPVNDRIPPIVVKAEYTGDKKAPKCMEKKDPGCRESLVVYLSEPVFGAGSFVDLIKNPFSYCLRSKESGACPESVEENDRHSQTWNNIGIGANAKWGWELPGEKNVEDTSYSAIYRPNNAKKVNTMTEYWDIVDVTKGDSIVDMVYYAYKVNADQTTRMPRESDWIKIRPPTSGDMFRDANGNAANPREIGVIIEGTNSEPPEICQNVSLEVRNGEICLIDCKSTICGNALAQQISYKMEIPGFGEVNLVDNPYCVWISKTQGMCYEGIVFDNGKVMINETNIPSGIKQLGFQVYALVDQYSLKIPRGGTTPIITNSLAMFGSQEIKYYTLKGEPLGSKKPSKAGVYIMRQGMASKMIAVLSGN